jgi:hypothetical protein
MQGVSQAYKNINSLLIIHGFKGRTIRKVMGGGTFSTCTNIFLNFLLVSIMFLNIIPCTNFFLILTYNFPY